MRIALNCNGIHLKVENIIKRVIIEYLSFKNIDVRFESMVLEDIPTSNLITYNAVLTTNSNPEFVLEFAKGNKTYASILEYFNFEKTQLLKLATACEFTAKNNDCEFQVGENGREATETLYSNELECEKICRIAFDLAIEKGYNIVNIDLASALQTEYFWRTYAEQIRHDYSLKRYSNAFLSDVINKFEQESFYLASNLCGKIIKNHFSEKIEVAQYLNNTTFGIYSCNYGFDINQETEFYIAVFNCCNFFHHGLGQSSDAQKIKDFVFNLPYTDESLNQTLQFIQTL